MHIIRRETRSSGRTAQNRVVSYHMAFHSLFSGQVLNLGVYPVYLVELGGLFETRQLYVVVKNV